MPITLVGPPESQNIRILAQWKVEEFTGKTTASVTLTQTVDAASGLVLCWLNGALVQPSTVTVSGSTVTLGSALIATDVLVVFYKGRGTT